MREVQSKLLVLCGREEQVTAENQELRAELAHKKKHYNDSMSAMQSDIFRLQEEVQQVLLMFCWRSLVSACNDYL